MNYTVAAADRILRLLLSRGKIRFNESTGNFEVVQDQADFPISLGFDQVALLQQKNKCLSRLDANISSEIIRGIHRPIPLIAANMSSVCDASFIIKLYDLGAFGILHRAAPVEWLEAETKKIAAHCSDVAVSIGVGEDQFALAKRLVSCGANIITIDIAHGYSDAVIELGRRIKKEVYGVRLILGNTINIEMAEEVADFADAIKVNIGPGLSCTTKSTAACFERPFTSIYKFREVSRRLGLPCISDGGTREASDFVKAVAAGASAVMCGSIFARCPESAAEILEVNGQRKKIYSGMSSKAVQDAWKGGVKSGTVAEGKVSYLDIGEPLADLLARYAGALRSGITYSGARNIKELQENARFTRI